MLTANHFLRRIKAQTVALLTLAATICITAIACSGGGTTDGGATSSTEPATVGIPPSAVVDYIHTALAADRTAYTKNVVNRAKTLEGQPKDNGVLDIEATEGWQDTDGIPLPAQMFRLGSEEAGTLADERGLSFTYNLISPWNINDNQAPKSEFEKEAMAKVVETGEPFKGEQEVAGQKYYSALYPDKAVAEACVTCHNTHPVHKERYPDKVFELGDVMGGIMINLPLESS